ncbi:MAG: glycoside hydrolase family 25 protein [Peptococcaceae bacterium]|nr:glycoside hydrolase family 25 protein [Peptococcaceae bacterium]
MQARRPGNSRGVDVSHWQGDIKWDLVKNDGISFAFIKATEGVDYEDRNFSMNLKKAKEAGILVGAYHFCTPSSVEDAVNEAGHFINVITKYGGIGVLDLPPVIDIEKNQGLTREQISKIVRAWAEKVKAEARVQPVIYSYTCFIRDYLDESLSDIPLWLAHYDSKQPPDSSGWTSWLFLQYTDKGQVSGINGNADLNEFNGGRAELALLSRKKLF